MATQVDNSKPRVAVLGGGNGTSRLLTALLPLLQEEQIGSLHALVHMADDGGSTGRLRDQYQVPAVGDLTKCLVALSSFQGDVRGEQFLEALDHRFDGGDFAGHTLRNIFLTSLERTSDIDAGVAMMARILQVPKYAGVVPTTLTAMTQQVVIPFNGTNNVLGEGQHVISHQVNLQADPRWEPGDVKVMFAEGDVPLNPRAREVLERATHIIVAPGHTYGTILPTLALPDLSRVARQSEAQVIAVMTLLTTPQQTEGWSGEDFVRVYESYLNRPVDSVVGNTGTMKTELVSGQDWVRFTEPQHAYQLIAEDVVSEEQQPVQAGDTVPRAVVVHDADKMATIFSSLLTAKAK